jgi:hypothetical protein
MIPPRPGRPLFLPIARPAAVRLRCVRAAGPPRAMQQRTNISRYETVTAGIAGGRVGACVAWRECASQNEVLRAFQPCPLSGKPDIANDRV